MNPFLGWRAIRFCLEERDIFRDQLRAILRASVEGELKMMYPMISCLDELNKANESWSSAGQSCGTRISPLTRTLEVGAMIEIPSAALTAERPGQARPVLQHRHQRFDPVLPGGRSAEREDRPSLRADASRPSCSLIKMTVDAAHRQGIWVSVCGEMAGDPIYVPLLAGLGVDELSAAPPSIPRLKFLIRRLKMSEARELAEFGLSCESGAEILDRAKALVHQVAPGLFDDEEQKPD